MLEFLILHMMKNTYESYPIITNKLIHTPQILWQWMVNYEDIAFPSVFRGLANMFCQLSKINIKKKISKQ